ncbi:MAG: GIY-YIG nuclease family protein [Patescibacteria group bacterium]
MLSPSLYWAAALSSLPSLPGVYWFSDENDNILYVGKAKSIKKRVASYKQLKRLPREKKRLVKIATQIKYSVLASEIEALLIEAELIRTHQPDFNILLKDDKSPIYIFINKSKFPKVSVLRKKELNNLDYKGAIIGPFQSTYKLKEVLKIARKIFKFCDKPESNKACFYYHINQCSGACIGKISSEDYKNNIKQLILFLKGKSKNVIKNIKQNIALESEKQNFEKAAILRDKLNLIKEVTNPKFRLKPDITLPQLKPMFEQEALIQLNRLLRVHYPLPAAHKLTRIEGYDVSNTQGKLASVSMVVFENGQANKSEYKLFNIKTLNTPNDYQMLKEVILRRQNHPEWKTPDLIIIDGGKGQLRAAVSAWQWSGIVISIAKNPDRIIIPLKTKDGKIKYKTTKLPNNHPALQLVQRVRDESHRFSKYQHKRRRLKNLFD